MSAKLKNKSETPFRNLELNSEEVKTAHEKAKSQENIQLVEGPSRTQENTNYKFKNNSKEIKVFILWAGIMGVSYYIVEKIDLAKTTQTSQTAQTAKAWSQSDLRSFQQGVVTGDIKVLDLAYRWTNVKRTPVDASLVSELNEEKAYLSKLFKITDEGVLRRIWVMAHIYGNIQTSPPPQIHLQTINDIKALTPPASMIALQEKVIKALELQDSFLNDFKNWSQLSSDPRVGQSDLPLREVYDSLLKMFANSPEAVKTSFYSHLCALSLI